MHKELYKELKELEQKHWWFLARREILIYIISSVFNESRDLKICDLGCGTGDLLKSLGNYGEAVGLDKSDDLLELCDESVASKIVKGSIPDNIPFDDNSFDLITMVDVLEHLDDDVGTVRKSLNLLKPGGYLVCTVPAYKFLWTRRDDFHEHKRRYRLHGLKKILSASGFQVKKISYYNTILFPIIAAVRLTQRMLSSDNYGPDLVLPPPAVNSILKWIFSMERYIIKWLWFPFGVSLIAVCRKPT